MKKQTILLSALALTMLASCEKEAVTLPTETKKAQITMQLGQYGPTKGLGEPTTETQVAVGLSFYVESLNAAGLLIGRDKMEFTRTGTTNIYTANADVDKAATKLKLTGNNDETIVKIGTPQVEVTLTPDVNTRQGDVNSPVVLVSGVGNITGTTTAKTAEVSVTPEMARIEIIGTNTGVAITNVKDVKILAIYLNNVKLNRTDIELTNTKGAANFLKHYVTGGIKYALYDKHPSAPDTGWQIVDANGVRKADAFGVSKAIGYNIFPQAKPSTIPAGKVETDYHPHVNIQVSYIKKTNGVSFDITPTVGFLNIKAFKNGMNYITSFAPGSVYTFSVSDITNLINDPKTPIAPEPEPETGSVTIKCTVASWELVTVTPEV